MTSMTLQEKYRAKVRRNLKYWLQDAGSFFALGSLIDSGSERPFIFALEKDEETWTAFFEDRVTYKYEGREASIGYAELESIFERHFRATNKMFDDVVEGNG